MNTRNYTSKYAVAVLAACILASFAAAAAPNERSDSRGHFNEHQREVVLHYFSEQQRRGSCPPGLAKKNNGCNPPGQVRQWQIGQQLPQDVPWYQLSRELQIQLGQAPSGYRYAAVDNNILLLELGTQIVVDVIQALGE